ncbi:ZN853 protein, partial [Hippolais icterina]|nr:ZN853 protein [Hippolais icterina]
ARGQCGKLFSDSSSRTEHQRRHTGQRPHGCAACGKRFGQRCPQRAHAGLRPYGCGTCGKRFGHSSDLLGHARTHS